MFLVNSRSHLVTAAQPSSGSKSHHRTGRTFSRSYGAILPSSFTRVLSSALGFSPCPPVSVWGTVSCYLMLRGFSREHGINHFASLGKLDIVSRDMHLRICLEMLPTHLNRDDRRPDDLAFSVPPSQ